MGPTLYDRLLRRDLGDTTRYSGVRGLYGDKQWIKDLDIVNELDGHTGCVNALSWSRSGQLLASGSDDTRVHIHSYLPESSTSQFNLATSIVTGHTQNIFSVKFMPHSNDRTVVSAAGDATVRIFDVEYSAAATSSSRSSGPSRGVWDNTSRLSEGDANAKVFRSHSDRVKRIVTESSPYFFLTCSEDGEVRQWDLREPESTYPGQGRSFYHGQNATASNDRVPPALISYKRYNIDLNTISCSPSRPYYIALGGNHLHCFLHDRRMLGRDRLAERGTPLSQSSSKASSREDEAMAQATQCVRRFAPNGQPKMGRTDNGHITACKISDADPNALIASWSGDHIYSFDLVRSPDAREEAEQFLTGPSTPSASKPVNGKAKESRDRKRKRVKEGSAMSLEAAERGGSRARTSSDSGPRTEDVSLRVNYGNGQREEIPIEPPRARSPATEAREADLPDFQRQSFCIAKYTVKLRRIFFGSHGARGETVSQSATPIPENYARAFSNALQGCLSTLPEIEDIIRTWRYPVNPLAVDVTFQRKLRVDREKAARFVQAVGTLARVLGGKIRTLGGGNADAAKMDMFMSVKPALNESYPIEQREHFGYDFLKAICLWLDSGPGGVVRGFTKTSSGSQNSPRLPIKPEGEDEEAGIDALDEQFIPYLLGLSSDRPILNIEASPFEVDDRTVLFESERAAVLAFAQAVKIPFEDITTGAVIPASPTSADKAAAQDRKTALRFWGLKVARGILMNAAEGVDFRLVDHAFGGLGRPDAEVKAEEKKLARLGTRIDPDEEDEELQEATLVTRPAAAGQSRAREDQDETSEGEAEEQETSREVRVPLNVIADLLTEDVEVGDEDEDDEAEDIEVIDIEDEEDDDGDDENEDVDSDSSEEEAEVDEDSEEEDEGGPSHILYRSGRLRNLRRSRVNANVPVSSHTRTYEGHCNVRTVKDVNFFGLQDEYVVSGSDSGHLFIWDSKTAKLVNILEGDGEVVNVIQGHPYEPMLAVSGIDNTIKIFSPDARARRDARLGIGVRKVDESEFSTIQGLGIGRRRRRPRASDPGPPDPNDPESQAEAERRSWAEEVDDDSEEEDGTGKGPHVADGGLPSRRRMWDEYRIRSKNDSDRKGNARGEYISRSMIQLLMGRLRDELADGDGEGGEEGGPRTVVLDEDRCAAM